MEMAPCNGGTRDPPSRTDLSDAEPVGSADAAALRSDLGTGSGARYHTVDFCGAGLQACGRRAEALRHRRSSTPNDHRLHTVTDAFVRTRRARDRAKRDPDTVPARAS